MKLLDILKEIKPKNQDPKIIIKGNESDFTHEYSESECFIPLISYKSTIGFGTIDLGQGENKYIEFRYNTFLDKENLTNFLDNHNIKYNITDMFEPENADELNTIIVQPLTGLRIEFK